MQNPKDISSPTTALDMALELKNVGNQNGLSVVLGIANQHVNGNVVTARAEGNSNGINGNPLRNICRLLKKKKHRFNSLMRNLISWLLQFDKSHVYYTNGSPEVHLSKNCYDNDIFNMFTQDEQYTELLDPILEPYQVPQNDSNGIFKVSTLEQVEVEKVKKVNRKLKEANVDLTTELARYKNQEKCFEISQEKYDKLESYVNGMNSRGKKQKENISNQKKNKAHDYQRKTCFT
uniref:Uncharacterized protein n=1 Tax=Tanacetum cinerariifolium TaxID=118510 RepID=A0A6L2MHP8_TANCI|nr:hypothetical protein [Tanacetum cinerariifolium]